MVLKKCICSKNFVIVNVQIWPKPVTQVAYMCSKDKEIADMGWKINSFNSAAQWGSIDSAVGSLCINTFLPLPYKMLLNHHNARSLDWLVVICLFIYLHCSGSIFGTVGSLCEYIWGTGTVNANNNRKLEAHNGVYQSTVILALPCRLVQLHKFEYH